MATRGTYKVDNFLLYNHWDNYPSGAAAHLIGVIRDHGDLKPFSIIRSMPVSETKSVFDGPAEFHYVIDKDKILHYSISGETLKCLECSLIEDWLNSHILDILDDDDNPDDFKVIKVSEGRFITRSQAILRGNKTYDEAKQFFEKGAWGNSSSLFADAFKWFRLAEFDAPQIDEYLKEFSPKLAAQYRHADTSLFDSYATGAIKV